MHHLLVTEGGADEELDAKLTNADYQRALLGSEQHDPTYINFLTRVSRGGSDQVLRYCRTTTSTAATTVATDENKSTDITSSVAANVMSNTSSSRSSRGLLLLSSNAEMLRQRATALELHPCPLCGAPRIFECQVG